MLDKSIEWEKDREIFKNICGALPTVSLWNLMYTLKHITHSQLIERDMFKKRIESDKHLYMHEMMYPVLQGTDSNTIAGFFGTCDLEVGGTDQIFNMLIGRPIMKSNNFEPQAVLAFKILEGLDGKEKMSKSLDNYVGITDEPNNMYGKIMSIPDSSIGNYFELCTQTPMKEVESIRSGLINNSLHPKEAKMSLAKQIVEIYHGKEKAQQAEESFVNTFQNKETPEDVTEIIVNSSDLLIDTLVKHNLVSSKTEFRRLVDEHAITNLDANEKISDYTIKATEGVYRIGKKRFCKIVNK
jgi:tyrosyl-tRNA synthetase